jgi:hypothetical protein
VIVFFSYAVITTKSVALFIDPSQLNEEVHGHLDSNVEIHPYDSILSYLKGLHSNAVSVCDPYDPRITQYANLSFRAF